MKVFFGRRRTVRKPADGASLSFWRPVCWACLATISACSSEHIHCDARDADDIVGTGENTAQMGKQSEQNCSTYFNAEEGDQLYLKSYQSDPGDDTILPADERVLYTSRQNFEFPSSSLLRKNDVPASDISRLVYFLRPEHSINASGKPEILSVRPIIKVKIFWNGAARTEVDAALILDIFVGGGPGERVEVSRDSRTETVLTGPTLQVCQGHALVDGSECDVLRSTAEIKIVIADANTADRSIISTIKNEIVIVQTYSLCDGDLTRRKERALDDMIEKARAAQAHIVDARGHAILAEDISLAASLTELQASIERKITASSLQQLENIISPDAIPNSSAAQITPCNRHLQHHIDATFLSLQRASLAATCSHHHFLNVSATRHLKS